MPHALDNAVGRTPRVTEEDQAEEARASEDEEEEAAETEAAAKEEEEAVEEAGAEECSDTATQQSHEVGLRKRSTGIAHVDTPTCRIMGAQHCNLVKWADWPQQLCSP